MQIDPTISNGVRLLGSKKNLKKKSRKQEADYWALD